MPTSIRTGITSGSSPSFTPWRSPRPPTTAPRAGGLRPGPSPGPWAPAPRAWCVTPTPAAWQYTAIRYTERLAEIDAAPSIGTVGDSYDNARAETVNGLYKRADPPPGTVAQRRRRRGRHRRWVHWWNTSRSTVPAETSRPRSSRPPGARPGSGRPREPEVNQTGHTPDGLAWCMMAELVQPPVGNQTDECPRKPGRFIQGLTATILLARLGSMALSSPDAIVTLFVRVAALGATSAASLSRWVSSSGTT